MSDLIPYGEQFEKIVDIIESAKERAYRKVNEELILMYRDIGEYISNSLKTLNTAMLLCEVRRFLRSELSRSERI